MILEGDVDEIKRTYRSNTFQVEFESPAQIEQILPGSFELLSQKNNNGYREAVIRMPQGNKPNDLIKALIGQIEIHSFREILPTMNDIFIETVKKAN